MAKRYFEIYTDAAGESRWRMKAANGEIVATGEGFTRAEDAERSLSDAVLDPIADGNYEWPPRRIATPE